MTITETTVAARIARTCSSSEVICEPDALAAYEVDSIRPAAAVVARSADEVAELIRFACAEKLALIPCGARTKLSIGGIPTRYDIALDLSRMNRVLSYEPRDLTLGTEPGITFAELAKVLAAENQFLPLDPPFANSATIGGILAADSVSPLRQRFGASRDFVLGMEFVTGYGARSKSGGRVVKNVTGYDLHKPMIGSLGTLAVITRINFKTFPSPASRAAFLLSMERFTQAMELFSAIENSPLESTVLAAFSGSSNGALLIEELLPREPAANAWSVLIEARGNQAVVARHRRDIASIASRISGVDLTEIDSSSFVRIWDFTREFPSAARKSTHSAVVFRLSAIQSAMPAAIERLTEAVSAAGISASLLVHSFGVIYFILQPHVGQAPGGIVELVREIFVSAAASGIQARIESAPLEIKRRVSIWGPRRDDFELMSRVKHVFDPENILSPGRFVETM